LYLLELKKLPNLHWIPGANMTLDSALFYKYLVQSITAPK